jgi:NTP pyrophosphatase (non-canonical NTP hydrolase)
MTLPDYQAHIAKLVVERGYDKETIPEVFLLLTEEVGELAKAIRRTHGMKIGDHSKRRELEDELADIFWLLLDLCNRHNIDLEKAFIHKEAKNASRPKYSNDGH